jgi:hypothetical protein
MVIIGIVILVNIMKMILLNLMVVEVRFLKYGKKMKIKNTKQRVQDLKLFTYGKKK